MNVRSALLVRPVCLLLVLAWAFACAAQGKDGSLTKDFDKLSPKERTKIAERETKEAAEDSGYQATMREADQAFQAGKYEDALAAFQRARIMRPYNVYPKVKIQDLQAMIKKRDEAEKAAAAASSAPLPPQPVEEDSAAKTVQAVPVHTPVPAVEISEVPTVEAPPEAAPPPVVPSTQPVRTAPPPQEQQPAVARPAPEATPLTPGERVYMEAGAVVTERTVDNDGKLVVYKKVAHSWGQTFYFKDGLAVSEREWTDRFSP